MAENEITAFDLLDVEDFHTFFQGLIDTHGDKAEQLMVLLVKLATAKAIIERALRLTEPLNAVLEQEDEDVDSNTDD